MHVTFIVKILRHLNHLSTLPPKDAPRIDILPCAVFVLQSAPVGLLRALWRKLCRGLVGKGRRLSGDEEKPNIVAPTILGIYGLLNLSLKTLEYEGSERNLEGREDFYNKQFSWSQQYFESEEHTNAIPSEAPVDPYNMAPTVESEEPLSPKINTASARRWQAHDGSIAIIDTSRSIVQEAVWMLRRKALDFSDEDTALFTRAATSLYLQALSLEQSDVVIRKTIVAAKEILLAFKLKNFFGAVGDTLQHWMRVILFHCGARRVFVRKEALDLLRIILRATWDSFGTFTRIRVPLLSVQTEVMERIVL